MTLPLQVDILYGPVRSRRLGRSLGINLLPGAYKLCPFNCVYCHYGWTKVHTLDVAPYVQDLPTPYQVAERVTLAARSALDFDHLTFSGNGEPTLHPQFAELVREVAGIRDRYRPKARLALLSNSTGLLRPGIQECLRHIDLEVFKLDAGTEETFRQVNRPVPEVTFSQIVDRLAALQGVCLQTLLVEGSPCNASGRELESYFQHVARIHPEEVHIYSIDRPVPAPHLRRVPPARLQEIARRGQAVAGVRFRPFWL